MVEPPGIAPGSGPLITSAFIAIVRPKPDRTNIGASRPTSKGLSRRPCAPSPCPCRRRPDTPRRPAARRGLGIRGRRWRRCAARRRDRNPPPATGPRVPLEAYVQNLNEMIATLKGRNARVILVTPLPTRWTEKLKGMYGKPPYDPADPDGFNFLKKGVRRCAEKNRATEQDPAHRSLFCILPICEEKWEADG